MPSSTARLADGRLASNETKNDKTPAAFHLTLASRPASPILAESWSSSSKTSTSQSVVLVTTSASDGLQTVTSFVGANPTSTAAQTSVTGQTQPGAATKVGHGAFGALVLAIGVGAFFL